MESLEQHLKESLKEFQGNFQIEFLKKKSFQELLVKPLNKIFTKFLKELRKESWRNSRWRNFGRIPNENPGEIPDKKIQE